MAATPMMIDLLSSGEEDAGGVGGGDDGGGGVEIISSFKNTPDEPIVIEEDSPSSSSSSLTLSLPKDVDVPKRQDDQQSSKSVLTSIKEPQITESLPEKQDEQQTTQDPSNPVLTPAQAPQIAKSPPENVPKELPISIISQAHTQIQDDLPLKIVSQASSDSDCTLPPTRSNVIVAHERRIIREEYQESAPAPSQISLTSINDHRDPVENEKFNEPQQQSPAPTKLVHHKTMPSKPKGPPTPNVSSFFCKAKASNVLSQIEGILNDKPTSSASTKKSPASASTVKVSKGEDSSPVMIARVTKAPVVVPEKRPVADPVSLTVPSENVPENPMEKQRREREKMLEIQRLKQAYRIRDDYQNVRPVSKATQEQNQNSFLSSMDPALLAVFAETSKSSSIPQSSSQSSEQLSQPNASVNDEAITARVYEVPTLEASRSKSQIKPLSLRIAQHNTFGQVKQAYYTNRGKSPHGLVLTYNDTPLFDSVTVGSSGISPRIDEKGTKYMELVLYNREVLAQVKQEKRSQLESGLEFLDSPVSNVDVSDLMEDAGKDGAGASDDPAGSGNGSMTLSIRNGRGECEVLPVKPEMTLQELLSAYQTRNPDVNLAKARLKFDGTILKATQTIADADLEDEDMLELIL